MHVDAVEPLKLVAGILTGYESGYQKHHLPILISLGLKGEIEGIIVGKLFSKSLVIRWYNKLGQVTRRDIFVRT